MTIQVDPQIIVTSAKGNRTRGLSSVGWASVIARRSRRRAARRRPRPDPSRSEEHTSELQSLMRISYAVFCLKKKKQNKNTNHDVRSTTNTNRNKADTRTAAK